MSLRKSPLSSRLSGAASPFLASRRENCQVSVAALACIAATTLTSPALAQSTEGTAAQQPPAATPLPTLSVESTEAKPKAKKKTVSKSPPVAPAAPTGVPAASAAAKTPPGGNPYADPNAPYKVDRSANTKITQPLLDTPRTVTTVTKEVMEDKQVTSIRELARQTPGVSIGTGEGGNAFGDVIFIRGFKATSDTYIDGIRDPSVSVRENFMVEQVEIIKGPSGSISGRGTTGGAVNLITKKPEDERFGVYTTTFGTDGTRRMTLDVNEVISPTLSVRANGMWQEAGVAGRDEVYDNRWGGALAATWKPSNDFKLTVDYFHLDLDQLPDWGVPWDATRKQPITESGVARSTFYGVTDRDFLAGKQDIGTITGELKLSPDTVLTSKLRQGRTEVAYVVSAPEGAVTTSSDPNDWTVVSSTKSRYQLNEILANQTDVVTKFNTGSMKHTLVAGIEISRENISRTTYQGQDSESYPSLPTTISNCPSSGALSALNPDTSSCWDSATDTLVLNPNATMVQVITKSAYVNDTVEVVPSVFVNGGLRLDDYDIDLHNSATSLARTDLMLNWNGGVTWKPASNGSVYAAVGTSTNPTGQELDAGADDYGGFTAKSVLLSPEKNTAYEIGTKWEVLQRRLLLTTALFQTTKENARETIGPRQNSQLKDTGAYRVRGVEFGAAGKITDALSIYGGAVFMESEITKSELPANLGAEFANIAHQTFNLLAKYKLTDRITVGGQAIYAGEIKGGTFAATTGNVLPDHWRFDALAEVNLTKNVDLQLNVINITDELYYDAFYRSNSPFVYVAPGRAGYATIKYKY